MGSRKTLPTRRLTRRLGGAALGLSLGGLLATASPHPAAADKIDDIGRQLSRDHNELRRIGQSVRAPGRVGRAKTSEAIRRKLVDAQVQFGMGNYDDASVVLYDLVEGHKGHPVYDEALYYLAESLFQKKDNLAARAYFRRLVSERGSRSKFYQQGLERLVELSLRLNDPDGIDDALRALDNLPSAGRRASVPYVRGKYAHFKGNHSKAIAHFRQVPRNSKYSLQADYFLGASQIAKGDLGASARTYAALIVRQPKNDKDRRIIELSHMALGRLFYERDQPSRAIDSYLNVNRKSDLFDDVLYEVAWVYVKNKEYPKALRALELLQLTDPKSSRLPEVRILEGNLRIRKAQNQYDRGTGNPVEEYDKALKVFTKTREDYTEPRKSLEELMAENADPALFIAQITGREQSTFETSATLPEVAVAWLREEPEVERLVQVETDLGSITDYIEEANKTIQRLELAVGSDAKVAIFPELAEHRYRILDIRAQAEKGRARLFAELARRSKGRLSATEVQDMRRLAAERKRLQQAIDALSGRASASSRVEAAKGRFTAVDQKGSELSVLIESTEAQIVALERYLATANPEELPKNIGEIRAALEGEKKKVAAMRKELARLRDDALVGRAASGASADADREAQLRAQLREALDAEAAFWRRAAGKLSGQSRRKVDQILSHLARADRIASESDAVLDKIGRVADVALREIREAIDEEKSRLAAYMREFKNYEVESRGVGSEVIGDAFGVVAGKFRDVLMKADVGIVDVSWSHKESNERLRRRLVLDRARERRTLQSDFGDVIRELQEARQAEKEVEEEAESQAEPGAGQPANGGSPAASEQAGGTR